VLPELNWKEFNGADGSVLRLDKSTVELNAEPSPVNVRSVPTKLALVM